jgi:hypothetical protein
VSRKDYFFDAAYKIYIRFLIGNLSLQHGDFTNTARLWTKDTASGFAHDEQITVPVLGQNPEQLEQGFTCVSIIVMNNLVMNIEDSVVEKVGHEDPVDNGRAQHSQHGEACSQQLRPTA